MKQKDLTVIIVAVFLSGVISLILSKFIIATPKNRRQQVEIVEPISASFPDPDKKYFNDQSIDPTRIIQIGDTTNPQPFSTKN